jgi:four helix bundle protein
MEYWSDGVMGALKNKNRGYQQLRVWRDTIEFYKLNCRIFGKFSYELRRVTSQAIASSDSVHRNIADGYCRRSIREYLNFLNVALGSLGGLHAYREAGQITEDDFRVLNERAFKLENGLLRLVESLEHKQITGNWIDHLIVKDSNEAYERTE